MGPRSLATGSPSRSTLLRSTFARSTFARSHVPRSHVCTFARSHVPRSHVPRSHVRTFPSHPRCQRMENEETNGAEPSCGGVPFPLPSSTFARSHVPTFPRFLIPPAKTLEVRTRVYRLVRPFRQPGDVAEHDHRRKTSRVGRVFHVRTFPRSTFPRSHVPTFLRSHVPRSHIPTFARSHVPTFNASRATPHRSGTRTSPAIPASFRCYIRAPAAACSAHCE